MANKDKNPNARLAALERENVNLAHRVAVLERWIRRHQAAYEAVESGQTSLGEDVTSNTADVAAQQVTVNNNVTAIAALEVRVTALELL